MIEKFSYNLFTIRSLFGDFQFSEKESIKFISTSSSEVKKNTLFVPLKGIRDGHNFIRDALEKGASSFLCEKNHPIIKSFNSLELEKAIFVDETLSALGSLASFHRNHFNPYVIGITGSSGKTTTKELLGLVVKQLGPKQIVVTEKNYNNEIGVPFTLFRINKFTKIVICEMGMNHKGEIARLSKIASPNLGIITNIGPCHIENLGSLENIAHAKAEIIEGIKFGGQIYIPTNSTHRKLIQEKAKKFRITLSTFSMKKNPNIALEKMSSKGFLLKIFNENFNWKMPGERILENLSAVVTVSSQLKFSPKQIRKGISLFRAKDKRFVIEKGNYNVINDTYNANPDSMESSLSALKQVSGNKPYYAILGDMKELGKFSKDYHSKLGEYCKKIGLHGLITFGKDSRFISNSFSNPIKNSKLIHFVDAQESIDKLISFIKHTFPKHCYILIKGSRSMKMERIVDRLKD